MPQKTKRGKGRRNRRCGTRHRKHASRSSCPPPRTDNLTNEAIDIAPDTPAYERAFPPLAMASSFDHSIQPRFDRDPLATVMSKEVPRLVQLIKGPIAPLVVAQNPRVSYSRALTTRPATGPAGKIAEKANLDAVYRYTSLFRTPQFRPSKSRTRIRPARLRISRLNRRFQRVLVKIFKYISGYHSYRHMPQASKRAVQSRYRPTRIQRTSCQVQKSRRGRQ